MLVSRQSGLGLFNTGVEDVAGWGAPEWGVAIGTGFLLLKWLTGKTKIAARHLSGKRTARRLRRLDDRYRMADYKAERKRISGGRE
jgi:hypothetical protein